MAFTFDLPTEFGIYTAYHTSVGNRVIHWITTISLLVCLRIFFFPFSLNLFGFTVSPSDFLFLITIAYYVATKEVFITVIMVVWICFLHLISVQIYTSFIPPYHIIWLLLTILSFLIQVGVGHRVFEGTDNFTNAVQGFVAFGYFGPTLEGEIFRLFPAKYEKLKKSAATQTLIRENDHKRK